MITDDTKVTIAQAYNEYELECKARNLSPRTIKRHYEDLTYFDKYYDIDNLCSTVDENLIQRLYS